MGDSDIRVGTESWEDSNDKSNDLNNSIGSALDLFMNEITQEVTGGGMIPMNLPKKEVYRIIQEAKKWFYKNYEYSVAENFYIIPNAEFETDTFNAKRAFKLPSAREDGSGNIVSVHGCNLTTPNAGEFSTGSLGSDFAVDKLIFQGMMRGGEAAAGETLLQYVVREKYIDMMNSIFINPISFSYNPNSHILKILGETPDGDKHLVLEVYESIPDEDLFIDEIFIRYTTAKVKKQLGIMLTTFEYNLPGDITINGDAIKDSAEAELEAIIEEIKGDEGIDYFLTS